MSATQITRREFLETAGVAGLVIGFHLPATGRKAMRGGAAAAFVPNAWLRIGADESVLVVVDRSEMGQGVTTSLPMLLAEELEADWSKVRIESAPADKAYTNPVFGMQGTGGSTSVRAAYTPLRKAGAAALEMLLSAAAETWGVDKAACRAEQGAVIHTPSNRRLTYGKLVAKAATVPLPHDVPLKDPKDWKILGTRVKRLDTPPKVDGSAQFGIDVKTPGLLVAVVARSPVFGGKVKSFDATNAKAVPGVKHVVQISTGVAVVADGYWSAKKGRDALTVTWDEGPTASVSSASISELFGQKAGQTGAVARHDGDAQGALPGAASKLDAAYELPFLAHATMEPMYCTAHVLGDGVDMWSRIQLQLGHQRGGAAIVGVPRRQVTNGTRHPVWLRVPGKQFAQGLRGREFQRGARQRREEGSVRAPPGPAGQGAAAPPGLEPGREQGRLGHAAPGGPVPRNRGVQVVRLLRRRSGRGLRGVRRSAARAPGRLRGGLRARRQPRHRRSADAERHRVRPHGRIVGRDHDRQGSRPAEQLPRLPDAPAGRDAGGGGPHRAQYRRAGRRRRAGHAADR